MLNEQDRKGHKNGAFKLETVAVFSLECDFYRPQGKVMFSQVSVHRGVSLPPGQRRPSLEGRWDQTGSDNIHLSERIWDQTRRDIIHSLLLTSSGGHCISQYDILLECILVMVVMSFMTRFKCPSGTCNYKRHFQICMVDPLQHSLILISEFY